jgi:hypothetical protein
MQKVDKKLLQKPNKKNQLRIKKMWEKSGIKISKELRDIIHGYVISDGYIQNGVLTIHQSKKQECFVLWLYEKLQPIRTSSTIKEVIRIHPKTQNQTRSLRFYTKAILNGFHQMWYKPFINQKGIPTYQKRIPNSINCLFNGTFISLWYAADGTKVLGSVGAKLEMTSFTIEERLKLKSLFFTKFGIKTQIISSGLSKKGNVQWALKIPANDYPKFRDLIIQMDLIPTVFPYKLHKKT